MPYKITGYLEKTSRIIVFDETDYSIEYSATISGGNYEIGSLINTSKVIAARALSDGEVKAYGNITPTYYSGGIDAYTKLMLHLDESPFTDSSVSNHTITNVGVTMSSSRYKFGGYSAYFGGDDYLSIADSEDWNFESDDFTIDFWLNFNIIPEAYAFLIGQRNTSVDENNFYILYNNNTDELFCNLNNGAKTISASWTPSINTWYHIALVRNIDNLNLYLNGTSVADTDLTGITLLNSTQPLIIGAGKNDTTYFYFLDGYMEEIRVSNGIARWTNNFTPPTMAYI